MMKKGLFTSQPIPCKFRKIPLYIPWGSFQFACSQVYPGTKLFFRKARSEILVAKCFTLPRRQFPRLTHILFYKSRTIEKREKNQAPLRLNKAKFATAVVAT